jgi:hypothetical protein
MEAELSGAVVQEGREMAKALKGKREMAGQRGD